MIYQRGENPSDLFYVTFTNRFVVIVRANDISDAREVLIKKHKVKPEHIQSIYNLRIYN